VSNFDLKKKSYGAAKMKPPVEFNRELLIWALNNVHMARLKIRGNDVANVTIAIEPLLQVGSLRRAEGAFPYLKEVLERYRCKVEMPPPVLQKTDEGKFMVLKIRISNILRARKRRLERRYYKELKLREKFEGAPRTGVKLATDLRPQY
jgi:hypothetical protein